jgi:hypothetical protein
MPPRSEDRDFGHPCGRRHPVLAAVSRGCPRARGRSPRVTHPCATGCQAEARHPVRLACVRRAASVRSEPGSNSQLEPPSPSGNGLFPAHGITAQGSPLGPAISRPPLPKEPPQRRPVRNPPQPPRPGSPPRAPQAPKKRPRAGTATRTPPRHLSGCLSPATHKPPPTHPFLPSLPCPKNTATGSTLPPQTQARGTPGRSARSRSRKPYVGAVRAAIKPHFARKRPTDSRRNPGTPAGACVLEVHRPWQRGSDRWDLSRPDQPHFAAKSGGSRPAATGLVIQRAPGGRSRRRR